MNPTLAFWAIFIAVAVVVYLLVARQYSHDQAQLTAEAEAAAAKRKERAAVSRRALDRLYALQRARAAERRAAEAHPRMRGVQ